jgi:hypothetical protein
MVYIYNNSNCLVYEEWHSKAIYDRFLTQSLLIASTSSLMHAHDQIPLSIITILVQLSDQKFDLFINCIPVNAYTNILDAQQYNIRYYPKITPQLP